MTTVPLTHGEEWGLKWDFDRLVENHDVDFIRPALPNVGGITEMMKVEATGETHAVGIVPHFTGPIVTAGHSQRPASNGDGHWVWDLEVGRGWDSELGAWDLTMTRL